MNKLLVSSIITGMIAVTPIQVHGSLPRPILEICTSPTYRINSGDTIIRHTAVTVTYDKESGYDKARALYDWVVEYMTYDMVQLEDRNNPKYLYTSSQALERHQGICYEYSLLYAALCRSIDIPAIVAKGPVTIGSDGETTFYHAWNKVYVNNTWLNIDPTFGDITGTPDDYFFDFLADDREITGIE